MADRHVRDTYPSRNLESTSIPTFCADAMKIKATNDNTQSIIIDILFPNLETIGTAKNRVVYIPTTPEIDINDFI